MLLVRYCIVIPRLNGKPVLTDLWFPILIISIVLITAAGYLINDYFDVKADEINKPEKLIVGRYLKRRKVMATQMVFNITGLVLGWFCALKANNDYLFLFHLSAAILLWYYSVYFKKQALIGNIIVSILVALVVIVVVAYESNATTNIAKNNIWYYGSCFALFAFLSNLVRELVKDVEDVEGDKLLHANTLPIKYGFRFTVKLAMFVTTLIIVLVTYFCFFEFSNNFNTTISIVLSAFCATPFLLIFILVRNADTQQKFKHLSKYIKLVMFMGILSMLFI